MIMSRTIFSLSDRHLLCQYPQLFTGIVSPWKGLLLYGPPGESQLPSAFHAWNSPLEEGLPLVIRMILETSCGTVRQGRGRRCWPGPWPQSAEPPSSTSQPPASSASGEETLRSWSGWVSLSLSLSHTLSELSLKAARSV